MSMVLIKVRVDETCVAQLDRIAADRRQSRATLGGLLLEGGLTAAVETHDGEATAPARATA